MFFTIFNFSFTALVAFTLKKRLTPFSKPTHNFTGGVSDDPAGFGLKQIHGVALQWIVGFDIMFVLSEKEN